MSNQMPIYSHIVPKSQCKSKINSKKTESKPQNLSRIDFDPLNYNHGGNFHLMNMPSENKCGAEKSTDRRESRRSKEEKIRRGLQNARNDTSEGKVEAYLRQNQVNIRQQQHRHSAVRQAEHRVNLRYVCFISDNWTGFTPIGLLDFSSLTQSSSGERGLSGAHPSGTALVERVTLFHSSATQPRTAQLSCRSVLVESL